MHLKLKGSFSDEQPTLIIFLSSNATRFGGLFVCFKSQVAMRNYKVIFIGTIQLNFSVSCLMHNLLVILSSFTSPFCYTANAVSSVPPSFHEGIAAFVSLVIFRLRTHNPILSQCYLYTKELMPFPHVPSYASCYGQLHLPAVFQPGTIYKVSPFLQTVLN